jgi:hypothetical protein
MPQFVLLCCVPHLAVNVIRRHTLPSLYLECGASRVNTPTNLAATLCDAGLHHQDGSSSLAFGADGTPM